MSLALGFPHPDYLLPLLTAHQFNDWKMYYQQEPWGVIEEDLQHSKTREVIFASSGSKMKGKKPTWRDFSILSNEAIDKPKQSPEQMKNFLLSFASAVNKTNKTNKVNKQNKPDSKVNYKPPQRRK